MSSGLRSAGAATLSSCAVSTAAHSATVTVTGHLMDTGILARVLDDVLEYGGDYRIESLDLGRQHEDESRGRWSRSAPTRPSCSTGSSCGCRSTAPTRRPRRRRLTRPAPADGVFPDDFYSTTNLETLVRLDREWLRVRAAGDGLRPGRRRGGRRSRRPHRAGQRRAGRRRRRLRRARRAGRAAAAGAARRGGRLRVHVARRCPARSRRRCWSARSPSGCARSRPPGKRILWVGGPAVVHTGAAPAMVRLVARRLRRRPLRRQRAGHPRHRVGAVRHLARRRPGQGLGRAARPRAPHPGDQHDPGGRLDRRGRRVGRPHRRRHARDGARPASRSCWSARCATTARCPTSTPT